MQSSRIRWLAALAGVQLRDKETELSAALWTDKVLPGLTFFTCCTSIHRNSTLFYRLFLYFANKFFLTSNYGLCSIVLMVGK